MCNSGVGLTPRIDGKIHHFSAGGLYNGLVLLIDDETRTYWDHITGEAVHGPLRGARMDVWGLEMTNVKAASATYPKLLLYQSRPNLIGRLMGWARRLGIFQDKLPPGFRATMGEPDSRLPEMRIGLGVIAGDVRRFYPRDSIKNGIDDELNGRSLRIRIGQDDGIPVAMWGDGSRPLQLFTRWYGFSYTFPGCQIYGDSRAG